MDVPYAQVASSFTGIANYKVGTTTTEFKMRRISFALLRPIIIWSFALSGAIAAEPVETGEEPESYRELIRNLGPMETGGLDPNLAIILQKYYDRTFGGFGNWRKIQSVRFDGLLHLPQGTARFIAFKKKPDYCKVVLLLGSGARVVMAFDGEDAWQLNTSKPNAEPASMPDEEARNFIRDATIGGHLLYSSISGKQINNLEVIQLNGLRCYMIEQVLPNGQRILSALDVGNLAERRQTTFNAVSGMEEVTTFSKFREIEGVRFPFASVMESGGEVVHRVEMLDIQVNVGAMPWMFQRPSGAYIPGEAPVDMEINPDLFKQPTPEVAPPGESFGLEPKGQTAFPDLKESEAKSILDDIGKPILK